MRWTLGFAVWTLLVWGGRVRNIAADDALDGFEVLWRIGLAVAFVALAVATMIVLWRSGRDPSIRVAPVVRRFAVFTAAVWVVQGGGILIDPAHEVGFKVVHTALAVGSITLAWLADHETRTADHPRFGAVSQPSIT